MERPSRTPVEIQSHEALRKELLTYPREALGVASNIVFTYLLETEDPFTYMEHVGRSREQLVLEILKNGLQTDEAKAREYLESLKKRERFEQLGKGIGKPPHMQYKK